MTAMDNDEIFGLPYLVRVLQDQNTVVIAHRGKSRHRYLTLDELRAETERPGNFCGLYRIILQEAELIIAKRRDVG
jgi:hypothetical protein